MQSTQVCCYDSIPKNGLRQCPNRTMKGKVYALSLQVQGRWHLFFLPPPLQPAVPGAYSGSMVAVSP